METANFILTVINTLAAVASAIAAFMAIRAKNEIKKIHNQIDGNRNIRFSGDMNIKNNGKNDGIIMGVNTGEIRK